LPNAGILPLSALHSCLGGGRFLGKTIIHPTCFPGYAPHSLQGYFRESPRILELSDFALYCGVTKGLSTAVTLL
jgi:hypothetical protein